jgi:hypothetical protein
MMAEALTRGGLGLPLQQAPGPSPPAPGPELSGVGKDPMMHVLTPCDTQAELDGACN